MNKVITPKLDEIRKPLISFISICFFVDGNRLFVEFKVALTENYVLQSLIPQIEVTPRYWSQSNSLHEVDFIIHHDNEIIHGEVKSEKI